MKKPGQPGEEFIFKQQWEHKMEIQQVKIKTTKMKDSRCWFRCSEQEQTFILSKMKKHDVAEYFRNCHEKLFRALNKKYQPKKHLPRSRVRTTGTKKKK